MIAANRGTLTVARALALLAAVGLGLVSCSGHHDDAPRTFGHDGQHLVVTPRSGGHASVSRATAERIFDHPLMRPSVVNPKVQFEGLATLHVDPGSDLTGTLSGADHINVPISSLEGHVVWIRVSRGDVGVHSCPNIPAQLPPGKVLVNPPPPKPFAFAVAVDATTGYEADWSEGSTSPLCPTVQDR